MSSLSWTQFCAQAEGRLERERRAQGITQQDMAARLGVSLSTFKRWERSMGEPSFRMAVRWAKALGLSFSLAKDRQSVSSDTFSARLTGEASDRSAELDHGAPLVSVALIDTAARRSVHGNSPGADFPNAEAGQ